MLEEPQDIEPCAGWSELVELARSKTALVVGAPGSGKSSLARYLLERLGDGGDSPALLSADMGQPAVGPPCCLALALRPPWREPDRMWFVGDISPIGNLVPAVLGVARLAAWARAAGACSVIVDPTGLVEGPVARLLKYHEALAAGAEVVIAIGGEAELEPLVGVLRGVAGEVRAIAPSSRARVRSVEERRAARQARYASHFRGGAVRVFSRALIVSANWIAGRANAAGCGDAATRVSRGKLLGLLDRGGFCLALGIAEEELDEDVRVFTAWEKPEAVSAIHEGRVEIVRSEGFRDARLGAR